jgi:hypothetical protein
MDTFSDTVLRSGFKRGGGMIAVNKSLKALLEIWAEPSQKFWGSL